MMKRRCRILEKKRIGTILLLQFHFQEENKKGMGIDVSKRSKEIYKKGK